MKTARPLTSWEIEWLRRECPGNLPEDTLRRFNEACGRDLTPEDLAGADRRYGFERPAGDHDVSAVPDRVQYPRHTVKEAFNRFNDRRARDLVFFHKRFCALSDDARVPGTTPGGIARVLAIKAMANVAEHNGRFILDSQLFLSELGNHKRANVPAMLNLKDSD